MKKYNYFIIFICQDLGNKIIGNASMFLDKISSIEHVRAIEKKISDDNNVKEVCVLGWSEF